LDAAVVDKSVISDGTGMGFSAKKIAPTSELSDSAALVGVAELSDE
jgi:hypothetical protein